MLNYWNNFDQPLLNCFYSITSPTRSLHFIPALQQRPQHCNNVPSTATTSPALQQRPQRCTTNFAKGSCDYKDNKHQVVWQSGTPPTGGFRVYLNNFPDRNHEAEFLGETRGERLDFEYGTNFHDNPVVDGMNLWNPFPQVGVSACNKYGICTPVVYGEKGDCGP